MRDLSQLSLASTLLGEPVTMPLAIAPTGLTGLFYGDGEIHGARAAQAFGIPFALSALSICSIEDVYDAVEQPFWFQVYLMRDRGFNRELIARVQAAQCSALMLTADLQVQGLRRRDAKNGLSIPPRLTLGNALDIATKAAWAPRVPLGRRHTFRNLAAHLVNTAGLSTLSEWIASQFNPAVTWQEVDWIRGTVTVHHGWHDRVERVGLRKVLIQSPLRGRLVRDTTRWRRARRAIMSCAVTAYAVMVRYRTDNDR